METLNQAWQTAATKMYDAQKKDNPEEPKGDKQTDKDGSGEVEDADFVVEDKKDKKDKKG